MKILLVHNYYGSAAPSGENLAVEAERALLAAQGHEVAVFSRHSDEIRSQGVLGVMKGALATPWNPWMSQAIYRAVQKFNPDVVHVHNTFPLISPAIFHAIGGRAARVLTLHNYRLFCPAAIPMRAGNVCTDCLDRRSVWPSMRHGCYRGSRLATLSLAISVGLHRRLGTWTRAVDAFITLTEFQRDLMVAAGLPAERVHVKPNFYPGRPDAVPWSERRPSVVYVGRLTAEKGVATLVRAWLAWGAAAPELRIVGDGHLRAELEGLAKSDPRVPVRFLGQLPGDAAQLEIACARLLVLPSLCYEGFPMVIREAFAFGTPVAVSDIGPLPNIVSHGKNGLVFTPGDSTALLHMVREAWEKPGSLEILGKEARRTFEMSYTEQASYRILMDIYDRAMTVHRMRTASA